MISLSLSFSVFSVLLWEEEETAQTGGGRGGAGGGADQTHSPEEEEESHLRPEEEAVVGRGLHFCRLAAGLMKNSVHGTSRNVIDKNSEMLLCRFALL